VSQNSITTQRYWCLEDTAELRLSNRDDYVNAFRELFDEAVRCRLRTKGQVAISLSGGLDSSSVAATAASFLKNYGQRLVAFSSVPISKTEPYVNNRFGDEFPYAKATAQYSGNIELYPLSSNDISPINGIRRILEINIDPIHGACNLYWVLDIWQSAKAHDCKVLLNGSLGNGGISWPGDIFSQPWSFLVSNIEQDVLIRALLIRAKNGIKSALPSAFLSAIRHKKMERSNWIRETAIHPDFASRIKLLEQRLSDPDEFSLRTPIKQRCKVILPGKYMGGAFDAEVGAAFGLEIRDPTADARVLEYVLSIPDNIFIDPKTGNDRWLIRETMKGRLPDEVRLNRNRGRQAGDLVPRLRASADEVETTLSELATGPAAAYVDVAYMRQVWRMIQSDDTNDAFNKAITVLTRGIMAGLFVNKFYK
jgi:asparagine synthase (glutamine-hydrolysing)